MFYRFLIVISCLFSLFACNKQSSNTNFIANVNGEILTLDELKNSFDEKVWNSMTKDEQRELINQWVDLTLLSSYAQTNDVIKNDKSLAFKVKNAEKKIYSNALISNELHNILISNEEMYNYYRLRQSDFIENVKEFRVQRIFFNKQEDMTRVKQMLDNNEIAYTPAAQRFSEEAIGRNGGYMSNLVTKNSADSLLWRALNDKDKFHEVTMPYRDGWIIARYYDSRDGTANSSFYDVKKEIEQVLRLEKQQEVYEQLLKEAKFNSNVIIEF